MTCDRDGERVIACSRRGHPLGDVRANYRYGLLVDEAPTAKLPLNGDAAVFIDAPAVLRRFCCPGCHVPMASEIGMVGEGVRDEMRFA